MNTINKLIAFGSSPIMGKNPLFPSLTTTTYPNVIANKLNLKFKLLARPGPSNSRITRTILHTDLQNALALVSWTSSARCEFRTENGWKSVSIIKHHQSSAVGFEKSWYEGPGKWEYTSVSTTLKEILLAQTFLNSKNVPYVFLFDNNEIVKSFLYQNPDSYLKSIIDLIDWKKFVLFDGQGFAPWCRDNGYAGFKGNHFNDDAHQCAADYIMSNWHLN
jgi:hypothetical protein